MGTRFGVRAYPADVRVEVFVSSGKVNLRAVGAPPSSGTLLGPLDLGVLDSIGHATVRNGVDSTAYLAWTHDRFVFSSVPLGDVLADVARWFDVRIDVRDSAAVHKRVTMSVPARSLSDVLGAATMPLGLHYEITGRTVVVR
jgi:ferric-dicitrate binding protein FerR (iron transport regulator)